MPHSRTVLTLTCKYGNLPLADRTYLRLSLRGDVYWRRSVGLAARKQHARLLHGRSSPGFYPGQRSGVLQHDERMGIRRWTGSDVQDGKQLVLDDHHHGNRDEH